MSLQTRLTVGGTVLLASLALVPCSSWAQAKGRSPLATVTVERSPSNVDLVNRALNPGASDPNVPLPHPSLAQPASPPAAPAGAQIYGRQEEGGGVLGLRLPIPAERGATGGNTRYSAGAASSELRQDVR
ncbi:hypothetical protein BH11PSE3_BH11PSE3_34020 [soil metagenome]